MRQFVGDADFSLGEEVMPLQTSENRAGIYLPFGGYGRHAPAQNKNSRIRKEALSSEFISKVNNASSKVPLVGLRQVELCLAACPADLMGCIQQRG